jgi:hypothetical protein
MAKGNGSGNGLDTDVAVERELPCKLTESELLVRGNTMADCELKIDVLKGQRSGVNAEIRKEVRERNKLAHTIEAGVELRTVLCKWIGDYKQNVWHLIRQDTGDEVETRAMTAADRQTGLPLDGEAPPPPADDDDDLDHDPDAELDADPAANDNADDEADPEAGDVVVPDKSEFQKSLAPVSRKAKPAAKSKPTGKRKASKKKAKTSAARAAW